MTLAIPYPYEPGMAESWIAATRAGFEKGESATFAITLRASGEYVGAVAIRFTPAYERAELGYWIGRPYWGQGYCTEAAAAVADYGFESRGLKRIHAHHMTRNPASGRVMQKIGMRQEGVLRSHYLKGGVFEDIAVYGLLREEWELNR
jgi:[ribosomal protein S5]-alanine N-acetyltransferase